MSAAGLQTVELDLNAFWSDIEQIRLRTPLVHNITNMVVMQQTANALLALGASPLMTHEESELAEIISISDALVINIGTLSDSWVSGMHRACYIANRHGTPVILDPVGAGASEIRTKTASHVAKAGVRIIRGNAGEIMALAGDTITSGGVDSLYETDAAIPAAIHLAKMYQCAVIVSGAVDYIISSTASAKVIYGSPLMTKVTGMGCTATALAGAFAAVNQDSFSAAFHTMLTMGIVGSLSAETTTAPGSFAVAFFDNLYSLTFESVKRVVSEFRK